MAKMKEMENIPIDNVPYFDEETWVCPINFEANIKGQYPKEVGIHDVTLRDGEQTVGVAWKDDERILITELLDELGVQSIEVGMPVVSKSIQKAIKVLVEKKLRANLVTLCRSKIDDVKLSMDLGIKHVIVEHPINPYICKQAYDIDVKGLLDRIISATKYAKEKGLHTTFFGWDAFRTNISYIKKIYSTVVKEAAPDTVVLTDTFGVALPETVEYTIKELQKVIPNTPIEFHGHNEFGLAVADALAAVRAGAQVVHTAINGLGERTGNAPTEEVVAALEMLLKVKTDVKLNKLCRTSRLVAEMSKIPLPAGKPIVGPGLFDVESGLVADVVSKFMDMGYEIGMSPFAPKVVGGKPIKFILGKGSGKPNLNFYLEKNGIVLTKEQFDDLFDKVKDFGRTIKGNLTEEDFMRLVNQVVGE